MKQLKNTFYFPGWYSVLVLGVLFFLSVSIFPLSSAQAADCPPWFAKLISLEGEASMRSTDDILWQPAEINTTFCPGDSLQVSANSRAILRLSDHSLLRLDAQTTVTFMPPQEDGGFWMNLLKGIGHFMSRVPRTLNIKTPVADAKIEGTEFLIRASTDEMFVTVFEGTVLAKNEAGELKLGQGQSAVVHQSSAPTLEVLVRPRDAVQWALHYPTVLQFEMKDFEGFDVSASSRIAESMASLKQGDRKKALEYLAEITEKIDDTGFLAYRAALRLSLGRVSKALDDLHQALVLKPQDGDILALKALVAVVQNDQNSALKYTDKAIKAAPNAVGPLLVRSYVLQAAFDLEGAREAVEATVEHSPDNALAWSRLAELSLMFRDLHGALAAAERAVEIDPRLAKTQSVLGFAHLIRIEIDAAKTAFEKAILMNQGAPMPRLGLGLALIREGELEAGRREIETAAMLNPSHALIRSYLGKAYYEEKRDELAVEQYKMARELDPLDPTPDLYSAILNQTSNKPVSALEDIERSITLNENRAVYRSRLLLDEDLAARSASLGRIYQDLGFQQRALVEGWRSVTLDPGNHSGHRLLADSYASLPRHEIARVSELLQSQLLQPLNMTAIQPQLAETNLAILQGAGPSDLSFNEFNPLFVRNNTSLQINGVSGSNNTLGNDLVISTIQGRTSLSLGQFRYKTDGFRGNNDLEHNIYNVFSQFAVNPKFNTQVELRRRESDQGDLSLNFDPSDFSQGDRRKTTQNTARIGGHFELATQSDLILSLIYSDRESDQSLLSLSPIEPDVRERFDSRGYQAAVQYLLRGSRFNLAAGAGTYDIDTKSNTVLDWSSVFGLSCPSSPPFPLVPCDTNSDFSSRSSTIYIYSNIFFLEKLIWSIGLTYEELKEGELDLEEYNPKIGLQWEISDRVNLRLAYLETIKRALIVEQTIEPTQVAGFNQFFDEENGSQAKGFGVGLDTKISSDLYFNIEGTRREVDVPDFSVTNVTFSDRTEDIYQAYLYWKLKSQLGISMLYQFERIENENLKGPLKLETTTVPVSFRYFDVGGFFAKITWTYLRQRVELQPTQFFDQRKEDVFIFDTLVGFRFSKRKGIISLEAKNLFDEQFLFQDTNFISSEPVNPFFMPERIILLRLTLSL